MLSYVVTLKYTIIDFIMRRIYPRHFNELYITLNMSVIFTDRVPALGIFMYLLGGIENFQLVMRCTYCAVDLRRKKLPALAN